MLRRRRFARAVLPHREALAAHCGRLLWSRQHLEDALQQTLVVALRDFTGREDERHLRRRLFRIATWTCFDVNRSRARRPGPGTESDVEEPAGAFAALEHELAYERILEDPEGALEGCGDALARACRSLTEKERAVLLLKAIGGLTCVEIAETLDVPLGTAQGLLTRARWKVRARLAAAAARGAAEPVPTEEPR